MEINNQKEEFDAFAKKYVKEILQESPSSNFTATLMHRIAQESVSKSKSTGALISKKARFVLAALFIGVLCLPYVQDEASFITIPELNFSFLNTVQRMNFVESFSMTDTVSFPFLFFGLMLIVQLFILKNYFDKRLY